MRCGFSTSACAAASAAAGLRVLLGSYPVDSITIDLPTAPGVTFQLSRCEITPGAVCCGVVKDAGDDPDVTHGLEIQAVVRQAAAAGIRLRGGKGVGKATLPGLPVPVGEAAINPGSHRLILQVVQAELKRHAIPPEAGFEITIQVPGGEQIASQTMNPKLGIVGGISILGTDGLVRPYSAPAFRASLFYELRVAFENGYTTIGLATGKRSSAYLRAALQDARGLGVVDVGDELGYPIERALKMGFQQIAIAGMIGKLSKLAQGRFQTHVEQGEIDFSFLANLAAAQGAPASLCDQIRAARTAHQVQNWLKAAQLSIEPESARQAAAQVFQRGAQRMHVAVFVFSLDGKLLGKASLEANHVD